MKKNLKKLVRKQGKNLAEQFITDSKKMMQEQHTCHLLFTQLSGWIGHTASPGDLFYVRTGSQLLYINKAKDSFHSVNTSEAALKKLDKFLHTRKLKDGAHKLLSFAELNAISQITHHQAEVFPIIFVQQVVKLFALHFKGLSSSSLSDNETRVIESLADFYKDLEQFPLRILEFQNKLHLGILKIKEKRQSGLVSDTLHQMMVHPELKSACELARSQSQSVISDEVKRLFEEGMRHFHFDKEVTYGQLLYAASGPGQDKTCQAALKQLLAFPTKPSKLKAITKKALSTSRDFPNFLVAWKRYQKRLPRLLHPYASLLAMQGLVQSQKYDQLPEHDQLQDNEIIRILLKHLLPHWFLHGIEVYREDLLPQTGLQIDLTSGFQSLVRRDCCVKKLHFGAKLFPVEEQPLWEALKKNTSIKHLDLSGIPLKKKQLIALADVLCVNSHITTLTLHHCQLNDSKLVHLYSCLKDNLILKKVDLSHNEMLSFKCIPPLLSILNSRLPGPRSLPSILFHGNVNINAYWQQRLGALPQPVIGPETLANCYDPTDGPLFECYNLLRLQLENVFFGVKTIGSDLINCAQPSPLTYANNAAELILNGLCAILDKIPILGLIASGAIKNLAKTALIASQYVDQVQRNEALKQIALKLTADDISNLSCTIAKQLTAAYRPQLIQLPSREEASESNIASGWRAKSLRRLNEITEKTKTFLFHQSPATAAEKVALLMIVRILGSICTGKIHTDEPLAPQLVSEVAQEPPLTDLLMHELYERLGLEIIFTKTGKEWKLKEILQLPGVKVLAVDDEGHNYVSFVGGETNPELYSSRIADLGDVARLGLIAKEKVYYRQQVLCSWDKKEVEMMDIQEKVYPELSFAAVFGQDNSIERIDRLEKQVRDLSKSMETVLNSAQENMTDDSNNNSTNNNVDMQLFQQNDATLDENRNEVQTQVSVQQDQENADISSADDSKKIKMLEVIIDNQNKEIEGLKEKNIVLSDEIKGQRMAFEIKFSEQAKKINEQDLKIATQESTLKQLEIKLSHLTSPTAGGVGASSSTSTTTTSVMTTHTYSNSTASFFQPTPPSLNNNSIASAPSDQSQHSIHRSP